MTDTRAQFTTALRQFADWLDANPQYDVPTGQKFLLCLLTNAPVREFAERHGLDVSADAEGNLSTRLNFGPLVYEVYGYVDFTAHLAAAHERNARRWADENGLDIVAKASE
ncbi:hypothetical protein LN042_11530 [Kitasatospora sp. RB6PN24]|uniref:hypothetical protein n=1 Tax=Kitasatospora humi TaxID=2893891 RepID=UPI001E486608|nr:hypothetical protein [Kitasatospora humi]MCC9307720.1 hypothetical protein [Kitasatospora humi]